MRSTLMVALLAVSLGLTATCLLVIRISVKQEIREGLENDLEHSLVTFRSIAAQRTQMLAREAALLADLPSLKALMSTADLHTIQDGTNEFYDTSGTDFFALTSTTGQLYSHVQRDASITSAQVGAGLHACILRQDENCLALFGSNVYEISIQPIYFGPPENGSRLGYVVLGYAIDRKVAQQISEVASADVAILVEGQVSTSTLAPERLSDLTAQVDARSEHAAPAKSLVLGREAYTVAFTTLPAAGDKRVDLVVLKSYDRASLYLRRVNNRILALGICALLLGLLLAAYLSRRITRPLEALVAGTRALGQGNFNYRLSLHGAVEVRELAIAFDRMRTELQQSQGELLESDRLATIGRMASFISHDLRHHLSAIYANAEFMSLPKTGSDDRAELFTEIQDGVLGMTDLIESLLLFSQTGQGLHLRQEFIHVLVERTIHSVRQHPECRDILITCEAGEQIQAEIDGAKLGRALYNLLLNACQASTGREKMTGQVHLSLSQDAKEIRLAVTDSGKGISSSIRDTLFQPFVSAGKVSGTGLGLTVAQHIVQEHGGEIRLESSTPTGTTFSILLYKKALAALSRTQNEAITALKYLPAEHETAAECTSVRKNL